MVGREGENAVSSKCEGPENDDLDYISDGLVLWGVDEMDMSIADCVYSELCIQHEK